MFALFVTIGKSLGLGEKLSKFLGVLLLVLIVVGLLRVTYNSIRAAGYADGKADEKAAWVAAEEAFKKRSQNAKDEATQKQVARDAEYAKEVAKEREKIDEAVAEGRSPFDAVFPFVGL